MACPIAFKSGLIRYIPMDDALPVNGWLHTCVWCGTITYNTATIPKNIFESPERIITRDGNPIAFNGIIVHSCPVCEPVTTKMIVKDSYEQLNTYEKHRVDVVQEKMVRRMRLKRPNFVRYE
jgi:hypothetical protein